MSCLRPVAPLNKPWRRRSLGSFLRSNDGDERLRCWVLCDIVKAYLVGFVTKPDFRALLTPGFNFALLLLVVSTSS